MNRTQQRLDGEIESALLGFISRQVAALPEGITEDEKLIESGRVDSLGLLQIVSFVEATWHVDLLAVGFPRDLQSVSALAAAIRREALVPAAAESA